MGLMAGGRGEGCAGRLMVAGGRFYLGESYSFKALHFGNQKPQMNADKIAQSHASGGVSTYALQGIRGCGVENPQGFGMMNADLLLCRTGLHGFDGSPGIFLTNIIQFYDTYLIFVDNQKIPFK